MAMEKTIKLGLVETRNKLLFVVPSRKIPGCDLVHSLRLNHYYHGSWYTKLNNSKITRSNFDLNISKLSAK